MSATKNRLKHKNQNFKSFERRYIKMCYLSKLIGFPKQNKIVLTQNVNYIKELGSNKIKNLAKGMVKWREKEEGKGE